MKWKLLATAIALSGYAATAHATTWFWVGGRGECMTMEESWRQVGYTGNSVPSHPHLNPEVVRAIRIWAPDRDPVINLWANNYNACIELQNSLPRPSPFR